MAETWLEAIAEQREAILESWERTAHQDDVADGLQSEPTANLTPWGDDLGPLPDDEDQSWRDEPEVEW